jgi:hypothetical protein
MKRHKPLAHRIDTIVIHADLVKRWMTTDVEFDGYMKQRAGLSTSEAARATMHNLELALKLSES